MSLELYYPDPGLQIVAKTAKDALKRTEFWEYIDENDWLRWDIDDCDPKEAHTKYCELQDDLARHGYRVADPQVEHDCISGHLEPIE